MANRDFKTVQALNREVKVISARATLSGVSAPVMVDGLGVTITRLGTGQYRATTDKFNGLLSVKLTIHSSAPQARWLQCGDHTSSTVDFRCIDGAGAETDLTAAVSIEMTVRNSTVK